MSLSKYLMKKLPNTAKIISSVGVPIVMRAEALVNRH